VWNSRYEAQIKSGKSKEAAEQAAFRLANGVVLSDLANLAALSLPDRLVALRADLDKLNLSDLPEHLKAAGRKKIEKLARKNGVEPSQLLAPIKLDDKPPEKKPEETKPISDRHFAAQLIPKRIALSFV